MLIWSPCPVSPCLLSPAPWHLGTMVPGAQHSAEQIYCFILTERSRYRQPRQHRQSGSNYSVWSERRGRWGGGMAALVTGNWDLLPRYRQLWAVILLLFRSQISRFGWFAVLCVCIALLHRWMQWYDEVWAHPRWPPHHRHQASGSRNEEYKSEIML